jgi:hypothetical protein
MRTYRLQVFDDTGALVVGALLRCRDDADAIARAERLALPRGRAVLTLAGAPMHEFEVTADERPDRWPRASRG